MRLILNGVDESKNQGKTRRLYVNSYELTSPDFTCILERKVMGVALELLEYVRGGRF
jgi:hypothetical protein